MTIHDSDLVYLLLPNINDNTWFWFYHVHNFLIQHSLLIIIHAHIYGCENVYVHSMSLNQGLHCQHNGHQIVEEIPCFYSYNILIINICTHTAIDKVIRNIYDHMTSTFSVATNLRVHCVRNTRDRGEQQIPNN